MDEVSYHKTDELVMGTSVPTVQTAHNVLGKHQDDKLAPDPENGSGRGGKGLEYESKESLLATVGTHKPYWFLTQVSVIHRKLGKLHSPLHLSASEPC